MRLDMYRTYSRGKKSTLFTLDTQFQGLQYNDGVKEGIVFRVPLCALREYLASTTIFGSYSQQ